MARNARQQLQYQHREYVKGGLINHADGRWARPTDIGRMHRSLAFGYKLGDLLGMPRKKRK